MLDGEARNQISEVVKRFAVFILVPTFIVGCAYGFASKAMAKFPAVGIGFCAVMAGILFLYLKAAIRNVQSLGFPNLKLNQILFWLTVWIAIYSVTVGIFWLRLGPNRSYWRDFIGIDGFLFSSSLPWAAWFPKGLRTS